jgi:hypothetical protein
VNIRQGGEQEEPSVQIEQAVARHIGISTLRKNKQSMECFGFYTDFITPVTVYVIIAM